MNSFSCVLIVEYISVANSATIWGLRISSWSEKVMFFVFCFLNPTNLSLNRSETLSFRLCFLFPFTGCFSLRSSLVASWELPVLFSSTSLSSIFLHFRSPPSSLLSITYSVSLIGSREQPPTLETRGWMLDWQRFRAGYYWVLPVLLIGPKAVPVEFIVVYLFPRELSREA